MKETGKCLLCGKRTTHKEEIDVRGTREYTDEFYCLECTDLTPEGEAWTL